MKTYYIYIHCITINAYTHTKFILIRLVTVEQGELIKVSAGFHTFELYVQYVK